MSSPRITLLLPFVLLSARPLVGHTYADQLYAQSRTDTPTVQVSVKKEEFLGSNSERQVQRVYLTVGTNQFAFTIPEGFRVDASNPQKIVLSDVGYSCFITFRFVSSGPVESASAQTCRELTLSRFPGAKIVQETTEFANNHSGPAFDLSWKNSAGTEQAVRTVFIPSVAGIMEFDLLASSSRFNDGRALLSIFFASFRSNEKGKLQITPLSDKS